MLSCAKKTIILTIEDEELVRRGFRYILEEEGYEVLEAANGALGIELVEQASPDLLLVDLRMPAMDGLDVLRRVSNTAPNTPVIIISGTGSIKDVIEALRLGAWDYLLKPISDYNMLLHVVKKNLERAQLRRENEAYQRNLEVSLARIREDEEAGRKIQLKLLPKPFTQLGPYTVRYHFFPSQYLSGDFLDIFKIDDHNIAFYTADVSGHGISSALITVHLKSFMRKYLERYQQRTSELILRPDELLAMLNNKLIEEDLDKHLTLFYGVIATQINQLIYTSAGQFPPPILWQNGGVEALEGKDTVIGLFPNVRYTVYKKDLYDDFLLAIFSDGMLDVLPQKTLAEKCAFLKGLGKNARIDHFMTGLVKRDLPDDLTVVTVQRRQSDE